MYVTLKKEESQKKEEIPSNVIEKAFNSSSSSYQ